MKLFMLPIFAAAAMCALLIKGEVDMPYIAGKSWSMAKEMVRLKP